MMVIIREGNKENLAKASNTKGLGQKSIKIFDTTIIGPGSVKMKSPTLKAITGIFSDLRVKKITGSDFKKWSLLRPLDDSRKKVFKYLDITENDLFPKY